MVENTNMMAFMVDRWYKENKDQYIYSVSGNGDLLGQ